MSLCFRLSCFFHLLFILFFLLLFIPFIVLPLNFLIPFPPPPIFFHFLNSLLSLLFPSLHSSSYYPLLPLSPSLPCPSFMTSSTFSLTSFHPTFPSSSLSSHFLSNVSLKTFFPSGDHTHFAPPPRFFLPTLSFPPMIHIITGM